MTSSRQGLLFGVQALAIALIGVAKAILFVGSLGMLRAIDPSFFVLCVVLGFLAVTVAAFIRRGIDPEGRYARVADVVIWLPTVLAVLVATVQPGARGVVFVFAIALFTVGACGGELAAASLWRPAA